MVFWTSGPPLTGADLGVCLGSVAVALSWVLTVNAVNTAAGSSPEPVDALATH
jgi:hypothetical protein